MMVQKKILGHKILPIPDVFCISYIKLFTTPHVVWDLCDYEQCSLCL